MKTIIVHIGGTTRFFNVDDAMSEQGVYNSFQQMLGELRERNELIRSSEIPNELLIAHGLSPAPIAFETSVPDTSLLADAMEKAGISFACCSECEHYENGYCGKYGDSIEWPYDVNRDCCASKDVYQVFDAADNDMVLAYFILKDKSLIDSQADLLVRLKKHFPELKNVKSALILPHPTSALPY